jgi:hypothetical protein
MLKRAGLDDALFQAPAFVAGVLEVQVGVVHLVGRDFASARLRWDSSRPNGVKQQALGNMARRSRVGSREIIEPF